MADPSVAGIGGEAAAESKPHPRQLERASSCPSSPADRSVGRAVASKRRVNYRFFAQPYHDNRSLSLMQRRGTAEVSLTPGCPPAAAPSLGTPAGLCRAGPGRAEGNASLHCSDTAMETGHAGASQGGSSPSVFCCQRLRAGREVPWLLSLLWTDTTSAHSTLLHAAGAIC